MNAPDALRRPAARVTGAPAPAATRRELEQLIIADLHGPAERPTETLPVLAGSKVGDPFLVGMPAPKDTAALDPARTDRSGSDSGDLAEEAAQNDAVSARPSRRTG